MRKVITVISALIFGLLPVILKSQFSLLEGYRICLDPGHGGHDSDDRPTDLGFEEIYYESDANWEAVLYIDTILRQLGADVILTKTTNDPNDPDRDPSLADRVAVANAFDADYFHSFHTNGVDDPEVNYSLVLFAGQTDAEPDDPEAKTMAELMDDEIFIPMKTDFTTARADIPFTGFMNGLGVLNNLNMPGTLSEAAFHSNLNEGRRLMNSQYRKAAAWSIVKSFLKFYEEASLPFGEVGGVVTDQSGNPINNINVTVSNDSIAYHYEGDSFLNGYYMFDWLAPGEYEINVSKDGFIGLNKTFSIEAGKYTELDLNIIDPAAAPAIPKILALSNLDGSDGAKVTWVPNSEPNLKGYRLYYATDDEKNNWELAADENQLTNETMTITVSTVDSFKVIPESEVYHFRLTAVAESGAESESDDYFSRSAIGEDEVLIVDGFDRTSGSYNEPRHAFINDYLIAIRDARFTRVASASNEAVLEGTVSLNEYDLVVWFLGDESTADETFSNDEQEIVKNYLESGGKLFVSGAEVAWDLDEKGSSTDRAFLNNYFKSSYATDGSTNYTPAIGTDGGIFSELIIEFGITYPEDFPDDIDPIGGGETIMDYAIPGRKAGVGYLGSFGISAEEGGVILLGFALETASTENQKAMMGKVLEYFDVGSPLPLNVEDEELFSDDGFSVSIFPNPTTDLAWIKISSILDEVVEVNLEILDINGQLVQNTTVQIFEGEQLIPIETKLLAKGTHIITLHGPNFKRLVVFIKF